MSSGVGRAVAQQTAEHAHAGQQRHGQVLAGEEHGGQEIRTPESSPVT